MSKWGKCAAFAAVVRRPIGVVVGIVALATWGHVLRANEVEINIPNGDFASPDSSQMPYFSSPSPIPSWIASIPDVTGVFYNAPTITDPVYGTFPNPFFINNLISTQAGFVYASPDAEMHQELPGKYQLGHYYHLQFGLMASIDSTPFVGAVPADAPIELQLYYLDPGNAGNRIPVGSEIVTNTGTDIVNQNDLDMFDLYATVPAGAVGQNIGIQIIIPDNSPNGGGVWNVGNLKLTTGVPEPASLAVLGCGVVFLVSRRRRAAIA